MDVMEKLTILTDAAKYDAACTSSGASRGSRAGYIGNTSSSVAGCCHTFSAAPWRQSDTLAALPCQIRHNRTARLLVPGFGGTPPQITY